MWAREKSTLSGLFLELLRLPELASIEVARNSSKTWHLVAGQRCNLSKPGLNVFHN